MAQFPIVPGEVGIALGKNKKELSEYNLATQNEFIPRMSSSENPLPTGIAYLALCVWLLAKAWASTDLLQTHHCSVPQPWEQSPTLKPLLQEGCRVLSMESATLTQATGKASKDL